MATATGMSCVTQIGETAGSVWHALQQNGPLTVSKLTKQIDAPRDVILEALGWLAREGKIEIEESGRSRLVSLR
jgi:DNA-binding GntR family transcriptional regulator